MKGFKLFNQFIKLSFFDNIILLHHLVVSNLPISNLSTFQTV